MSNRIATPAIEVRPFVPGDVDSLFDAVRSSVDELSAWLPWCHAGYARHEAEAWVAHAGRVWAEGREFPLAIVERASGRVIGGTGINQIDALHGIGNLGYWVATPFTGRGIARRAARQAAALGLVSRGLARLEIVVLVHNLASQRVAEAAGARREGVARNRLRFQGRPHDAVVYALIPSDLDDAAPASSAASGPP